MRTHALVQSKSWIPIIALLAMLLLLFLLWKVVLVFMLAAFFAFLLYPLVAFLDRKLPHVLSIICVYLIIALLLGIVIGLLVPVMADQAGQLADNIPGYVQKARNFSSSLHTRYISLPPVWRSIIDRTLIELQQGSVRLAQESIGVVFAVFGSLLTLVLVPLFAFFMLLDNKGYRRMIDALTPKRHRKKVDDLLYCTGRTLWSFFKGEFLLMSVVGIADGVGLALVGTPYPVVLGVIGGLLEVVPSIGPTVTNIIVILIALTISPVAALKAASITIIVQILENVFLVPVVMGKTVGLSPITISFAIILGGSLGGIAGAIMAVPIAMIVKIVILYFYVDRSMLPENSNPGCGSVEVDQG